MLPSQVSLLLLLLLASSLGPGLFFVRRFKWDPLETLTVSVALSHLLVFAAAMLIFACRLPIGTEYVVTAASVLLTLRCRRDIVGLLRDKRARCALLVWGGLFLWLLLVASSIRHYSGGAWYGDWFAHFDRVTFFAHRGEVETQYLQTVGGLAARPPLMNLLVAHFLNQIELRFELFQVAFMYFNSMAFLGAVLFASKRSTRPILLLGILLALTPFFVQNTTYTWTKLYAAFFVVTGVALYSSGISSKDMPKTVAAFGVLAVALITHYSAGPYLVLLALHYLFCEWYWRRRRFVEITWIVVLGSLILSTGLVWLIATYGLNETLTANTSVQGFASETGVQSLWKVVDNISATLVPYQLRDILLPIWEVESGLAQVRDVFFLFFQHNLLGMFGLTACLAAAWLIARDGSVSVERAWRWGVFCVLAFVLGVGVHGGSNPRHPGTGGSWGVAHVCLQPIALLGLCWIANGWERLPPVVRRVVIIGRAFEVGLGIMLHTYLQGIDLQGAGLGLVARQNARLKWNKDVLFLGDSVTGIFPVLIIAIVALPLLVLGYAYTRRRADERSE